MCTRSSPGAGSWTSGGEDRGVGHGAGDSKETEWEEHWCLKNQNENCWWSDRNHPQTQRGRCSNCNPPTLLFIVLLSPFFLVSQKLSSLILSKALQGRDDQICKEREEGAEAKKKLQQQLEEQTAQQAELRGQLDHLSLRKEELKQQLQDKHAELEEVKMTYR